ncbi:hypothetical protein [Actinopolymorpha rutila]|uniref:Uncharacterized protein n=1 Tax=Actinopolymorpha rutila TaxID=446787 RepID=A0A852Z5K8_9ACTN|nr:hypothetical protein [Actinopolymorpha rutila]NYH88264.1 hypothetical protein [Actinopolymorpha rutila]
MIATAAWTSAAEAALALGRRWTGTGKWLLRELRAHEPELADRWLSSHSDPTAIAGFVRDVLAHAGGPLFSGYTVAGERPSHA